MKKESLFIVAIIIVNLLFVSGFVGCGERPASNIDNQDSGAEEQLRIVGLNEPILIEGSQIEQNMGHSKPEGTITLTFSEFEITDSVEDQFTGKGTLPAQGKYVVVYYTVESDLKSEIQPATQINYQLAITDDQERTWEKIDYRPPHSTGISGDFAVSRSKQQPEESVAPGFSISTAIAFDIPKDTGDIYLTSKNFSFRLPLQ